MALKKPKQPDWNEVADYIEYQLKRGGCSVIIPLLRSKIKRHSKGVYRHLDGLEIKPVYSFGAYGK